MAANVNEARFSSNFEDEVVVTTTSADPLSTSTSDTNATAASLASPTNPFSAVEPEPAKDELVSGYRDTGLEVNYSGSIYLNTRAEGLKFNPNMFICVKNALIELHSFHRAFCMVDLQWKLRRK